MRFRFQIQRYREFIQDNFEDCTDVILYTSDGKRFGSNRFLLAYNSIFFQIYLKNSLHKTNLSGINEISLSQVDSKGILYIYNTK